MTLSTYTFEEVNSLKVKQLNELLKQNKHKKFSRLTRKEKIELLTGQPVPDNFKSRKLSENVSKYNQFRSEKSREWGCSIIDAGKKIKAEGLWQKPEAPPASPVSDFEDRFPPDSAPTECEPCKPCDPCDPSNKCDMCKLESSETSLYKKLKEKFKQEKQES